MLERVWRKGNPPRLLVEMEIGAVTMGNSMEVSQNTKNSDFPGGPVVKNPPSNVGDTGSIPGQGTKIPHAGGQLSPCTTTTEPVSHKLQSP